MNRRLIGDREQSVRLSKCCWPSFAACVVGEEIWPTTLNWQCMLQPLSTAILRVFVSLSFSILVLESDSCLLRLDLWSQFFLLL